MTGASRYRLRRFREENIWWYAAETGTGIASFADRREGKAFLFIRQRHDAPVNTVDTL
jgi:hypothetical protein